MERSVLIHFDLATGKVQVEALGFEGLSCLEATQPFEEALGIVEGEREFKPEAQTQRIVANHQQYQRQ
ncbi:MAG: DUF2997 domain-containing protein [Nostoc sp. DedSLP03]|uniref:DUF2997 domain-containing protein n=1 Tax=Nostoc sp. DedSLP03 TaxID=3075400 RepID=UPI002AD599CB|nr:DUF2997 domain-containing protein [Nostoc sp. DedSLP03]MDZ7968472.1 DUF2997 domain-containing protein [Nostoc sp. DedSLP03]